MQFMKKTLCALILCAMTIPCTAFADNTATIETSDTITLFSDSVSDIQITEDEREFMEFFASQIKERNKEITVPDTFNISSERFGTIYRECMGNFLKDVHPEIFYFDGSVSYNSGTLRKITPSYSMTDEEIEEAETSISLELEKIKGLLNDSMTDTEKVLTVHDYIAAEYEYDTVLFSNPGEESRTLDTMVAKKKGVCQGYASLFKYVMDNIGIECECVPSDECRHVWNKVRISIDGEEKKWYNIDVTADDPLIDMASNISHKNFLVNDDEIKDLDPNLHGSWNEYKWDSTTPATISDSTDFSDSVIHNVGGQMIYKDNKWYGFAAADDDNNNVLSVIDIPDNEIIPLYTPPSKFRWFVSGTSNTYYSSQISSMVLFEDNIFFNSPDKIYVYNTKTNSADIVYNFEDENPDKKDISKTYIYGIRVRNNNLYAEYTTCPYNTLDDEGNIISAKMDDLIPVKLAGAFPCSSEILPIEGRAIRVNLSIPDSLKNTALMRAAQYNENNLFIGFANPIENSDNDYLCSDDCKTIKAFIWDSSNQKPLADVSNFTF